MKKRVERRERIKAIEREFRVASVANRMLGKALDSDPSLLSQTGLRKADYHRLARNLEGTFLVRVFAEFEAGLRDLWRDYFKKKKPIRTEDLINNVAARCSVHDKALENAHAIRKHRNALVHEAAETADAVSLELARQHLCLFVSRLPLDW
jgi:hypothetical protein